MAASTGRGSRSIRSCGSRLKPRTLTCPKMKSHRAGPQCIGQKPSRTALAVGSSGLQPELRKPEGLECSRRCVDKPEMAHAFTTIDITLRCRVGRSSDSGQDSQAHACGSEARIVQRKTPITAEPIQPRTSCGPSREGGGSSTRAERDQTKTIHPDMEQETNEDQR